MHAQRRAEHESMQSLIVATDMKMLEISYAKRIARKEQLHCFMATAAEPQLFWRPAEHTPATQALEEEQRQELEGWKVGSWAGAGISCRKPSGRRHGGTGCKEGMGVMTRFQVSTRVFLEMYLFVYPPADALS